MHIGNHGYIHVHIKINGYNICYRHMEKVDLTLHSLNNPTYNASLRSDISSASKQGK